MYMKNLKEYIKEGLFDDIDNMENTNGLDNASKGFEQMDKEKIIEWICDNIKKIDKNKLEFDLSTTPITVDYTGNIWFENHITSLTNDLFQWGVIKGDFKCYHCPSLKSLEGSPKEVRGDFYCSNCLSLKSLEGGPKEVGGDFDCHRCNNLTSLKGAPEKVGKDFDCDNCPSLKSLEGGPEEVGGSFYCSHCCLLTSLKGAPKEVDIDFWCNDCYKLTSLKGAPKVIGGNFICNNRGAQFTEEDVKKVSKVKGEINCI